MKRIRYFTETMQVHEDLHHESQRSEVLKKGQGSWLRIDDSTILVMAELSDTDFQHFLQDHHTVAMLPSLHEKTTLTDHLKKKNKGKHHDDHLNALSKYGVEPTDTTSDAVAKIISLGHTQFSPDK